MGRKYVDGFEVSQCQYQEGDVYAVSVMDTGFTLGFIRKDDDGWSWAKDTGELDWDRGWTATGSLKMLFSAVGAPETWKMYHVPSRAPREGTAEKLAKLLLELHESRE